MDDLDPEGRLDQDLRHALYAGLIATAEPPATAVLAEALGVSAHEVEASLARLAERRTIALVPGTSRLWMAHPFSASPTAYPVRAGGRTWWANCAWDALGIPVLLGLDCVTETRCPDCGEGIRLEVSAGAGEARSDASVVHFLVPPRSFWEDIGFT